MTFDAMRLMSPGHPFSVGNGRLSAVRDRTVRYPFGRFCFRSLSHIYCMMFVRSY
ncbi:hypothetical protein NJ7G_0027 [Natrinema sp. J7-2]|nr:hypothetical protein NJ7G_0027 [Natrinema sp. J7-2]